VDLVSAPRITPSYNINIINNKKLITLNKMPQIVVPVDVNLGFETTFFSIKELFLGI